MAHKVLIGIDYPPDRRAEPGDVVDDIPAASVSWLIAQGVIEDLNPKPAKPKPAKAGE